MKYHKKVDVGYYSWGGPNHSKNSPSIYFSAQNLFLFIAASHTRGADLVVSSNFTPTGGISQVSIIFYSGGVVIGENNF